MIEELVDAAHHDKRVPEKQIPTSHKDRTKVASKSGKTNAAPKSTREAGQSITKSEKVLQLLRRKRGASIVEIQAATTWQPHSVRGFLAATVRKRLGLDLLSEKTEKGERRYRIIEG